MPPCALQRSLPQRGACARLRLALALRRRARAAAPPAAARLRCAAAASSARERRSGSGRRGAAPPPPSPPPPPPGGGEAAMRLFAQDEQLFFTPRRRERGADAACLRVVYAYPNDYSVGITSLGYQLVWSFLATHPSVDVARLFLDAHEPLPQAPHLLGFSLSWELDYANVLTLLERSGVPLLAAERGEAAPLVFGGGSVLTGNPEPYAAFFDAVLLGDGEELLAAFVAAAASARDAGAGRQETLRLLSRVPGVYVPSLYDVAYDGPAGAVVAVTPRHADVPTFVAKQTYRGATLAASTVVSPRMAWENIFMVEVVRSCPEMCRFCTASYLTLPFRPAPLDGGLLEAIERGLTKTRRLGLLGASVTQHPQFEALLAHLMQPQYADVRLSIASVRAATVTPQLAAALSARNTESLTIAVESGSARLRAVVNKKLSNGEIVAAARAAQGGGLRALKLYTMVGVPGETDADVDATVAMLAALRREAPRLRLTLGCSTFVPKPHTPFQWWGVDPSAEARLARLDKAARAAGFAFRPESYKWSVVQALLSRGDRRLAPLLLAVRGFGDSLGSYRRAFKAMAGQLPPLEHYAFRTAPREARGVEALPWGHLRGPLPEATLAAHAAEAQAHMDEPSSALFEYE